MKHFFIFNGINSIDKNITLLNYTPIFLPQNNFYFTRIPGKDGSLRRGDNAKQDIIINCDVVMSGEVSDINYYNYWLQQRGELRFWDMLEKYYIGEVVGEVPATKKKKWLEMQLNFRCHPIKYGITRTFNITDNPTIYNLGTYPTKGMITVDITANVDHIQVTLQNTGEFIYLEHDFIPGEIVTIDLEEETAYKNGYSIMKDCYLESDFFEIPVGEFKILVSSGNATLKYTERWL